MAPLVSTAQYCVPTAKSPTGIVIVADNSIISGFVAVVVLPPAYT